MFGFGKKKEQAAPEKPELLKMENIRVNCAPMEKEETIRTVGQMLVDSGYVGADYVEAMLKREESFATNIGNGIALPHGVEEAKKEIKSSGIAIMVFPEGTDWGTEKVKLVIGIAGAGEEHLEILSTIAEKMAAPEDVDALLTCSEREIYQTFTEKGAEV